MTERSYLVTDGKLVLNLEPAEEGGYVVTCPFDPQLVTEAETLEEAFENAYGAADALRQSRRDLIESFIERTPGVRGGRPCIAGTGVSVRRIVGWHQQGLSPSEIAEEIPHLTLAQVYGALAWYYRDRDEVDADMAQEDSEAERLEREHYQSGQPG